MALTELVVAALTSAGVAAGAEQQPLVQQNNGRLCLATEEVRVEAGKRLQEMLGKDGDISLPQVRSYLTRPVSQGGAGFVISESNDVPVVRVEVSALPSSSTESHAGGDNANYDVLSVSVRDKEGNEWRNMSFPAYKGFKWSKGLASHSLDLSGVVPPSCSATQPVQYCKPSTAEPMLSKATPEPVAIPECSGTVYVSTAQRRNAKVGEREISNSEHVDPIPLFKFAGGRDILACLRDKGYDDVRRAGRSVWDNYLSATSTRQGLVDELHLDPVRNRDSLPLLYVEDTGHGTYEVRFFDLNGILRASPQFQARDGGYTFSCENIPLSCAKKEAAK